MGTMNRRKNEKNTILNTIVSNLERDREIYRLAIDAWEKDHSRLKYTDLPKMISEPLRYVH